MQEQTQGETINVEVAYALPDKQQIIALQVTAGTTAYEAIVQSGIVGKFEGIDIESDPMGIFGKAVKPKDHVLKAGERVEIYRPLIADPKEARKARATQAKEEKAAQAKEKK